MGIDAPTGPSLATPVDGPLVARRRLRATRGCVPRPSAALGQDRDDTRRPAQPKNPMNGTPQLTRAFREGVPGERGPHLTRGPPRDRITCPPKRAGVPRNPLAPRDRDVRTPTHRTCPRPVSRETDGSHSQQHTRPPARSHASWFRLMAGLQVHVSVVDLDPNGAEVQTRRDGTRPGARRTFVHEGRARVAERSVAAGIQGTRCTSRAPGEPARETRIVNVTRDRAVTQPEARRGSPDPVLARTTPHTTRHSLPRTREAHRPLASCAQESSALMMSPCDWTGCVSFSRAGSQSSSAMAARPSQEPTAISAST